MKTYLRGPFLPKEELKGATVIGLRGDK